jgi:hypothetical protein
MLFNSDMLAELVDYSEGMTLMWDVFNTGEAIPVLVVKNEITDKSRWTIGYRQVFKINDKFYKTHYSLGATEDVDIELYPDGEQTECLEVFPREKTVIVYEA